MLATFAETVLAENMMLAEQNQKLNIPGEHQEYHWLCYSCHAKESSLSEITKIFQVSKAYIASQYGQCIVPSILDIQDLLPYFFCNQY